MAYIMIYFDFVLLISIESALAKYFQPIECELYDSNCVVMACYRKDHFPKLFIRTAR